jgi:ATP-dependent DNA helicase RecQ
MNTPDKYDLLKQRFGHNNFRAKQEEAIDALLEHKDLLMILPTGGGKSLSFQLPSMMMQGTTIVISPLIALMQDQVQSLNAQQMHAAMLSSSQESWENDAVISQLLAGALNFLYISPERLNTQKMQQILSQININFFVIDEAHCISEWGHEFRDDYRSLSMLKQQFPNIAIAAFTATATPHVRDDIIRLLNLNAPVLLQGEIFRSNLNITVQQRVQRGYDELLEFLQTRKEFNGIIYMPSRKKCEELSAYLNSRGFNAAHYHAGMSGEARDDVFKAFVFDRINIVVATIAFGMGIDKSDIRFVVHMSMPKTIENYYQEIGRAGRDGDDADVLLLYLGEDMVYAKMRLDEIENEAYRRHLYDKLSTMYRYVSTEECRHQFIAKYFHNSIDPCESACDNCLAGEVEKRDITTEAQKVLATIYRSNQSFGKSHIIDILRGSSNQKILQNGHDELSVYGIGKELPKKQWLVIIDRLLETEHLHLGEYHVLKLSAKGVELLKGEATLQIASDRLNIKEKIKKRVVDASLVDYDKELFERLRQLRADMAEERGVPAYIIFNDKALKAMAKEKPVTEEAMLGINGVGKRKFEQFGEAFLFEISSYM